MAAAKFSLPTTSTQPRRAPTINSEVGTVVLAKYAPSTSYATSGDAADPTVDLAGLDRGKPVVVQFVQNATTLGYQAAWDATNKKVLLWNGTTQATSTTDLSACVFDVIIYAP